MEQKNALSEIRMKYVEELEEILQCPVCYNALTKTVPMCLQGHHVCSKCQPMLENCPFCKSFYSGTRNFLAEGLSSKFDEIKSSLGDPQHSSNKIVHENKICVETQTNSLELNDCNASQISAENDDATINSSFFAKGVYPCLLDSCKQEFPSCRMIPHVRNAHKGVLIQSLGNSENSYSTSWEIEYEENKIFYTVLNVLNIGLFFIVIKISEQGDLYGNVFIVNTKLVAGKLEYELKVSLFQNSVSHKGTVKSCRIAKNKLYDKCLFVNKDFMLILLKNRKQFMCSIDIKQI